jgi:AbrB family looped-hinge helix DNA binding protein
MSKQADAEFRATITSDGLIAVPVDIREKWNLRPGDQLWFDTLGPDEVWVRPVRRRSVLERLDELRLPPFDRPLAQEDIENAITEAVTAKELRSRST